MSGKSAKLKFLFFSLLAIFFSVVFFRSASVSAQPVTGSGDATVNIRVSTPVPQFSLIAGADQLDLSWDWDAVSPGYYPPGVTSMLVEISSDNGLNYGIPQSHPANDFVATYTCLNADDYLVRVTINDGNDYDYVVGPASVAGPRGINCGGGGRPRLPADTTDVTITGLAYPGPSTVVIFTYNSAFQQNITPDSNGNFTFYTTSLPSGSGALSFTARDPSNVLSATIVVNTTIPVNTPFTISDVNLPPTITISQDTAVAGEDITLSGYGYRNDSISVTIDGPTSLAILTQVNADGSWQAVFNTSTLTAGTYSVSAISNSSGGIISPESEQLQLQITSPFPTAPVCQDGIVTAPEQCDDGNSINGDDCNDSCMLEADLPMSSIDQPSPSVLTANDIDLYYTASSPNGTITAVSIFYSRNGAPYDQYNGTFNSSPAALIDLADGDYEVYSIARDSTGAVESPPSTPDATFVINAVIELNVLGYPEKRSPRQGNWAMPASLNLYQPGTQTALYQYDITTDNQGRADIAAGNLPEQNYTFLIKGSSQLSKRLESPAFRGVDLLVDFTFGGSIFLYSGDVFADDYINGMDLAATVIRLYSGFLNADLNRDGLVNGMDLSIVVTNLYKAGDGV